MNLHDAREKAKRLTAGGVPTVVVKDAGSPGGWRTVSVVSRRAAVKRHAGTPKRKTSNARYAATPKGRAARARADARRNATLPRKLSQFVSQVRRKTGVRLGITVADVEALQAAQGNVCPITKRPLDSIKVAIDHAWYDDGNDAETLRGLIDTRVNPFLGRTDQDLFDLVDALVAYALKRRMVAHRRHARRMGCLATHAPTPAPKPKRRRPTRAA